MFKPDSGTDAVVDLTRGSDVLDLSALDLPWSDVETSHEGRDLHVELGGGVEVVLLGLGSQGLERSDVIL